MSDIDLATLHKTRLEERVHYKLSWWARRLNDKQKHINKTIKQLSCKTTTASSTNSMTPNKEQLLLHSSSSSCYQTNRLINSSPTATSYVNRYDGQIIENYANDEAVFTSSKRRRSGTWP